MKVRLDHSFDSDQKTLSLILDKNDGGVRQLIDQFDYEDLSEKELLLLGRLWTGFNIAFERMWH